MLVIVLAAAMAGTTGAAAQSSAEALLAQYSACLDLKAVYLDDGRSDANTIASAVEQSCSTEFEKWLASDVGLVTKDVTADMKTERHQIALIHVLEMRRGARISAKSKG